MFRVGLLSILCLLSTHAAFAQSVTYVVEPTHTFVYWEVRHFGISTSRGRFDKKDGRITVDTSAKTGSAEITIDMRSISTGLEDFDKQLKGKNFFAVEEFPEGKFQGDQFSFDGEKITAVTGTLTMRGVTLPVTLKVTRYGCYRSPIFRKQVCGGDFETQISRSQYGMGFGAPFVADAVKLLIQLEALRETPEPPAPSNN
jgi:polyisoprenoid-binding protein YceI